jgi:hypothetical protein
VPSARYIDSIYSFLFCGQRRAWRIDLKIFVLPIESRETDNGRALKHAKCDTLIAQRENTECRARSQTHEIASIDLDLQSRLCIRCNGVAFNERKIESRSFPVCIAGAFEADFATYETDSDYARLFVVLVRFVVECANRDCGNEDGKKEAQKNWRDLPGAHFIAPSR